MSDMSNGRRKNLMKEKGFVINSRFRCTVRQEEKVYGSTELKRIDGVEEK